MTSIGYDHWFERQADLMKIIGMAACSMKS